MQPEHEQRTVTVGDIDVDVTDDASDEEVKRFVEEALEGEPVVPSKPDPNEFMGTGR